MIEIAAVCVAALFAGLQGVTLFVVKDIRDRVARLETREMDKAAAIVRGKLFESVT